MTNNIHESNVQQIDEPNIFHPVANCEEFWTQCAKNLEWFAKWETINASYNCLDRHIKTETRDKVAFIFIAKNGLERKITFFDLYKEVNRLASSLKSFGLTKGDCVAISMPLVPEAIASMLACCRLGIRHAVIDFDIPLESLKEKLASASPRVVITTDELKEVIDHACPNVKDAIIVKTTDCLIPFQKGRDHWYQALLANADNYCLPEKMDTEEPICELDGITHNTGKFLVSANSTTQWLFDLDEDDIFWSFTDLSTIEGHSFIVYGGLSLGITQIICEKSEINPWPLIEKYKVTVFATHSRIITELFDLETIPSFEATFQNACGQDLSSLRLIGSLGHPLPNETASWLYRQIGKEKSSLIDAKIQADTGAVICQNHPFG